MAWMSERWLHLLMLAGYLLILAHHAWKGKQQTHSLDDYLTGGRGMGGILIGLSFYATFMSTNTFIGAAGKSWDVGLVWWVGGFVLTGLCCCSWFLVAPRFVPLTKSYGSLTVCDFLGTHYRSERVRRLAAVITAFASVVYLVAIYQGAALALASFLEIPYVWSAVFVFLVVTAYTLTGGFSSVVLTDALQGLLMVFGAVALPVAVILHAGGIDAVHSRILERDSQLLSWQGHMSMWNIVALSLAVGIKYLVEPRQLSRFYGLKDSSAVRTGAIVAPLLVAVTYLSLLPVGTLAHAVMSPDAVESSDEVVPLLLGAVQVFGPVLGILFLLILASAAMSSIDSVLLVAASTIDRDLLGSGFPTEDAGNAMRRTRWWVVTVSLASMLVSISPFTDDIVNMTAFSGSLYGACFFPALVMGLFRVNRDWRSPYLSMFCGAVAVVAGYFARQWGLTDSHEVYAGMAVGIGTLLLGDVLWGTKNRVA
jgi:SSS family transporter